MRRARREVPAGHGELLTEPAYESWIDLAERNAERAAGWDFAVDGISAAVLRREARQQALASAVGYTREMGLEVDGKTLIGDARLLIATGHQPEFYHPGVWVKDFLLQRFRDETGSAALDVVVDTDAFDAARVRIPCMEADMARCDVVLTAGVADGCWASAAPPAAEAVAEFRNAGLSALAKLPAPALGRHFETYCGALAESLGRGSDLGQVLTGARRRYEAPARTDYLELGVSRLARTSAWARFVAHIWSDASRFAEAHNAELHAHRALTGTRSQAQPFPDLIVEEQRVELPFWAVRSGRRMPVFKDIQTGGVCDLQGELLYAGDAGADVLVNAMVSSQVMLAPRAVTLTMFLRMFVCDLFLHGVGGGKYDRATDAIIRRVFEVEPPEYAVASMTLHLPLGGHVVTEGEIAELEQRLHRLEHNPDQMLDDAVFDSPSERERAIGLVREKAGLVQRISAPAADKRAIGAQIREVNRELSEMLGPLMADTQRELETARTQRDVGDVLTDRTYPFCLWSPLEVSDKVR